MKMSEGEITTTVFKDLKDMLEDLSLVIPDFQRDKAENISLSEQ